MLSSIRNFFLAFFVSLIVCGIGAYFLLGFVDRNLDDIANPEGTSGVSETNEENTGENTTDENDKPIEIDESEFTALILGIDAGNSQHDEKREADTIILLNLNAKTKTLMLSALPCDLKTEVGGYILRLGAVYAEFNSEKMIETVRAYTGLHADYLCVFDYKGIEKVFEILGDVEYDIPMDMYYKPKPYYYDETTTESETEPATEKPKTNNNEETTVDYENEPIDLKSGKQKINAEKAVQLLRYKSYSNGNSDRMITQMAFIEEVIKQKITFENLANAKKIYTEVKSSIVETNMDEKDFEIYSKAIFSISEYEVKKVPYPGIIRNENGVSFISPDVKSAVNRYMDYRKK